MEHSGPTPTRPTSSKWPAPSNQAVKSEAEDGTSQIVLYDAGIGAGGMFDHWGGGAFGRGLVKNIGDAYRFLIQNYAPGD